MRDFRDELVGIYASYPLCEIKNSLEYQNLCEENDGNGLFHSFRKDIEHIKQYVESLIDIQSSEKEQVSESLIIISMVMNNKKKEILNLCRKLIIDIYSNKWSKEHLEYFKTISDKMTTTKYDYFLSFTRRKPLPYGYNIVNNNYEPFITTILGEHSFTQAERIEKNLLARSIHHIIRNKGFKGFFYPDVIGNNQLVDPKVKWACENSHVFIQLIQNIMFEKPSDGDNYCFKEYNYVKDTLFLFSWDNVPGDDDGKLKRYLKDDFAIDWVENAEINKSHNYMTLNISEDNENSAKIIMDDNKEKAILKIKDGRTDDLNVKKECGKLNIYAPFSEERIMFVLAEDSREKFIKRPSISFDYVRWHRHVLSKDIVILRFLTHKKDSYIIKEEIEKNICDRIENYKQQLINNVP